MLIKMNRLIIPPNVMNKIFTMLLLCFCLSCSNNKVLENALKLAGDNRSELELVLAHYNKDSKDSLKHKAACFLIENMPNHYSYADSLYYKSYYYKLDSIALVYANLGNSEKDKLYRNVVNAHVFHSLGKISDIEIISSDFLIANIDKAFDVWQNSNWTRHIDFDAFCEYILPYKAVECQDLDDWRDYFRYYSDGDLRNHEYCELYKYSSYKACETVNDALRKNTNVRMINEYDLPVRKMSTLANIPFGTCSDYNLLAVSVMRAKGIPCAIDFTPQWPFRSLGHSWCVLLKNFGRHAIFEGAASRPASPHKEDHKMAKVFRQTYAANDEIKRIHSAESFVPAVFQTTCIKDVTAEYMDTRDIEIPLNIRTNHKYAYLAVFDNQNWVPVHWGEVKGRKALFRNMGKDIVYLPIFYSQAGIKVFADPVLLTMQGNCVSLKADTTAKCTLTLLRKYPPLEPIYQVSKRVVGGRIEASDNPLFEYADTLHIIREPGVLAREIKFDSTEKTYRYWRYYPPNDAHTNMAEMFFYEKDSVNETIGTIIGTDGSWRTDGRHGKEAVFDRDALTFFDAPSKNDCWVGMDFGKPVQIERIVYLPRNDGNCIEIGDEYELFYWGENRWQSLGRKTADGVMLAYVNCPDNALFLLHNHTKGREERIFTYENEKQIWW